MFGTLIESRAVTPRRTGSSIASILIHSAIITGGVIATAKDFVIAPPAPPVATVVHFAREVVPPPAARRRSVTVSNASVVPAPFVQRLTLPTVIPVGIPPVDFTATPTAPDFGHDPVRTAGIFCERDCASSTVTDSAGRQLWNTTDLLMRLLENPVPPRYPETLRRAGVEGDVVVKFVVDTNGRVDQRTVEILRSTHDAFTAAVRETISKLRFAPATSSERKVRALAVMPFHFTLR